MSTLHCERCDTDFGSHTCPGCGAECTSVRAYEALTAEERAVLDGCYRCICSGCARRRELIAKALRLLDEAAARVADLERASALADKGRYENAIAADLAEKRALQAEGELRAEREAHARTQHWALRGVKLERDKAIVEGLRLRQRVATAMENPLTVEAIRGAVLEALAPPSDVEHCIVQSGAGLVELTSVRVDAMDAARAAVGMPPIERTPVRSYGGHGWEMKSGAPVFFNDENGPSFAFYPICGYICAVCRMGDHDHGVELKLRDAVQLRDFLNAWIAASSAADAVIGSTLE